MNPVVKKALAALAITKGIEKVQEIRRPKRSLWSRLKPVFGIAVLGAGVFYLNKTGKLQPMVEKAKDFTGNTTNGSVMEDSLRQPAAPAGV